MAVPVAPSTSHDWVKWTVQDVAVIVDPFTGDFTVVDQPSCVAGEAVGCSICGEPLTDSSVLMACTGEELSLP
jgi:hypothetical protein